MDDLTTELTYETKISLVIVVLLMIVGCIMYTMKDKLFSSKQVEFDPVVKTMDNKQDKDNQDNQDKDNKDNKDKDNQEYIPSNSFTGRKPGYVFKTDEQGLGYYKDKIEMDKLN